jgi:hypothetical protein
MQVGMAHTRTADLDQNLSGSERWLNDTLDLRRLANTRKSYCSHEPFLPLSVDEPADDPSVMVDSLSR